MGTPDAMERPQPDVREPPPAQPDAMRPRLREAARPRARVSRASEKKRARELYRQANRHIASASWDAARRALLELANIRGYRGRAVTGLARLAFERGRYAEAARIGRRAVRAGGGTPARMILGNALLKLGQNASAAAVYRRVLRSRPGHGSAKRNLALAERRLGK